jgi:hypothetical protein
VRKITARDNSADIDVDDGIMDFKDISLKDMDWINLT